MWLLLIVLILLVLGVAYGLYTRKGSGINSHPGPDSRDPVIGDETKVENGDLPGDEPIGAPRGEGGELDQRGTR